MNLSNISPGDVAIYKNIQFAIPPEKIVIRAATEVEGNPVVSMHLDSATGPVIATAAIQQGQWQTYNSYETTLTDEVKAKLTGVHDIYLTFTGSMNINWFAFTAEEPAEVLYGPNDPERPDVIYGDLNDDQEVTAEDALIALQASTSKITLDDTKQLVADVDGEKGVTAADALQILQHATQKITQFPIENK